MFCGFPFVENSRRPRFLWFSVCRELEENRFFWGFPFIENLRKTGFFRVLPLKPNPRGSRRRPRPLFGSLCLGAAEAQKPRSRGGRQVVRESLGAVFWSGGLGFWLFWARKMGGACF